jgi:hypothetical protein
VTSILACSLARELYSSEKCAAPVGSKVSADAGIFPESRAKCELPICAQSAVRSIGERLSLWGYVSPKHHDEKRAKYRAGNVALSIVEDSRADAKYELAIWGRCQRRPIGGKSHGFTSKLSKVDHEDDACQIFGAPIGTVSVPSSSISRRTRASLRTCFKPRFWNHLSDFWIHKRVKSYVIDIERARERCCVTQKRERKYRCFR